MKFNKSKIDNIIHIAYFPIYVLVSIILLGFCCFFPVCFYVLLGFIFLGSIMLNVEQMIMIIICSRCFIGLFKRKVYIIIIYLLILISIKYLIQLIKKEKRINLRTIIPLGLLGIFLILPIHTTSLARTVAYFVNYYLIFLVFENREQIKFNRLVIALSCAFLVSGVFGLFANVSTYLKSILPYTCTAESGNFRFSGLFEYVNPAAITGLLVLCALLVLYYQGNIKDIYFYVLFIPCFIFSYLSLSRSFILGMAIALVIYAILVVFKHKLKSLYKLLPLGLIIIIICCIFLPETNCYIRRINYGESSGNIDVEITEDIQTGEVHFDPGRKGIWSLYINDYFESPQNILFGRGVARGYIGQMHQHNFLLHLIWTHGIIGVLIIFSFIFGMINWKKLKDKKVISLLLVSCTIAIPMGVAAMVEFGVWIYTTFILYLIFVTNEYDTLVLIPKKELPE